MRSDIEFIQFLPNGRRKRIFIQRDAGIAKKAIEIKNAGYRLECKALEDGMAIVAVSDPVADKIVMRHVVKNGEDVPLAIDGMINEFHTWMTTPRQPRAAAVHSPTSHH